jgi:hypothetical protein
MKIGMRKILLVGMGVLMLFSPSMSWSQKNAKEAVEGGEAIADAVCKRADCQGIGEKLGDLICDAFDCSGKEQIQKEEERQREEERCGQYANGAYMYC